MFKLLEQLEPDFDNAICEEEKDDVIEFGVILDIDIVDSDGVRRSIRQDSTTEAGNSKSRKFED